MTVTPERNGGSRNGYESMGEYEIKLEIGSADLSSAVLRAFEIATL